MSVKLAFAYLCSGNEHSNSGTLTHISERTYKDFNYLCPLCKSKVIPRKGPIRQHHFSHMPESQCTASEETVLHFNAKHFIQKCIQDKSEIVFNVPGELMDEKYQLIMGFMGMKHYLLPLSELSRWYNFKHAIVEHAVSGYIADVAVKCYQMKSTFRYDEDDPFFDEDIYEDDYEQYTNKINLGDFAFEINVTHPMGQEKISFFKEHTVPFLEVKPQQTEEGLIFTATAINIPDFLMHLLEKIKIFLSREFEEELFQIGRNMYQGYREDELKQELRIQVINQLANELGQINFRKHISKVQFEKINRITAQVYKSKVKAEQPLLNIKYKTYKEKNYVSINDMFSLYAAENMLFDLIKKLHEEYKVNVLIGERTSTSREKVVGFSFLLPDKYLYGQQLKQIMQSVLLELKSK